MMRTRSTRLPVADGSRDRVGTPLSALLIVML